MTDRELTPVFDGAKDLPVRVGWYPCALKGKTFNPNVRRFWNGEYFSVWVRVGESSKQQESAKAKRSLFKTSQLYWCGLTAPYKP